ncbi:DUF4328 domain-containing protein [Micromonospora sediminimaris]|uniref:DUF4328 domain-containing protein n=1 Tax=Micromonospora sediminimaris TaxID=547162 RepID=A0A9W5UQX2_9ACTN|nr:DUF4328 domain-containing protein [Micromonospora sediminimaris]GIJ33010.1 hypothetical protein Vse01_21580 [Micromonospora sediminimaris]SFD12443.1 protein of unknown function [Micromonospora sediminimaris]
MRCHTCDTETDVRTRECPTCRTPVGSPTLYPGARVRPVRGVGRAASAAVAATAAFLLLTVAVQPVNALLAERAADSRDTETFLLTAGVLELSAALLYQVAFLVAIVLVIIWTWRARTNLDAFPGAGPTNSDGWAIAGWLVPFVNFVMPHRVVASIARESLWRLSTPVLVHVWWGSWLVFLFAERFSARSSAAEYEALPYPQTSTDFQAYVDHYLTATGEYLVPAVFCAVAGGSLIVLIQSISAAQTARIARSMPTGPILPGMTIAATADPAVPAAPDQAAAAAPGSAPSVGLGRASAVPDGPGGTI